jgi:hypothetical protein
MSSFTWKRARDLETQQGREDPAGSGDTVRGRRHRAGESRRVAPAYGTANQLRRSGNRVHRLLAHYAGAAGATSVATACIRLASHALGIGHVAWLASRKAGLEYRLDVHDPALRLASAALPPGHPVYANTVAVTHVIAAHTPPPSNTSWRPSQWIP